MKKIITLTGFCIFAMAQWSVAQSWTTTGNTGTNPSTDFIGTTDNKALKIRTNNSVRVTVNGSGKVGIGNTSPAFKLDVKGSINTDSLYRIGSNPVISSIGFGNSFLGLTYNTTNTGTQNTFTGSEAGHFNTSGSHNSFIGYAAGAGNTTGADNTFVGEGAGYSNGTGSYNTIMGKAAGYFSTNSSSNTFIGYASGYANNGGNQNSFMGFRSGQYNTTGKSNAYLGGYSGYSNSTGIGNAAMGDSALYLNTNSGNTALGAKAGYVNTFGSNNTFIGYAAGQTGIGNLTNAAAIGANASVTSSNCMVLGNGVNVGIGNTSPVVKMHLTGSNEMLRLEGSTNPSMQFKENGSLVGFLRASAGDFTVGTNNTNTNNLYFSTNGSNRMTIDAYGKVGIGTSDFASGYMLSVAGKVICTEMRVALQANWPDYVFQKDYKLLSLDELEQSINTNKHLPGMLSAAEMNRQNGIDVGTMQTKMVEKIEELTLYVIQLKKEIDVLKASR